MKAAWLFPADVVCLTCGRPSGGQPLCESCQKALRAAECPAEVQPGVFMLGTCSAWYHEGPAKQLVHRLKFDGVTEAADLLAQGVARAAAKMPIRPDALVTSVPMPDSRRRERGIDHGMELAVRAATLLSLPYAPVMRRVGKHRVQRGLGREQRLRNLTNAFEAAPLHGRQVVLIDDVLTTGATAHACARALMAAGASGVWVLTADRVRRKTSLLRRFFRRKGTKR